MSKHTPGPWEASEEDERFVIQHEKEVGKAAIAVTAGAYPKSKANARLIAAAPEMYDLLLNIAQKYDSSPDGPLGKGFVNGDFLAVKRLLGRLAAGCDCCDCVE